MNPLAEQAAREASRQTIAAQPGQQSEFVGCNADICFYGGAAGGGKTYGLMIDPLNLALKYKGFGAVIFRRTSKQVMAEGGLWDKSEEIFLPLGARPQKQAMKWTFDETSITFAHMEHEKNRFDWQGAEIAYIGFDELTHFTEAQFWYMVSRNRSTCGAKPLIRATLNPDPDHFAAKMLEWYINPDTGYAIPERSGVWRYFIRQGDTLLWFNSRNEIKEKFGAAIARDAKSFTFILSTIEDNKILLEKNPQYLSNLMSLPTVERERLRYGNWKIRPQAGMYFSADKFQIVDAAPGGYRTIRYWDRAATPPSPSNPDPDYTVGLEMMRTPDNLIYVLDMTRERLDPLGVENLLMTTANMDGKGVEIILEQDPAQAGKMEIEYYIRRLLGFPVKAVPKTQRTEFICRGASSQQLAGNVRLVRGAWNKDFITELINFPQGRHDDIVTTFVGGFNELAFGPVQISPTNYIMGGRTGTFDPNAPPTNDGGFTGMKQVFQPRKL